MEGTECKLRTRLTNSLCSNDADSLALMHHALCGKVTTVAFLADSMATLTSKYGAYFNHLDACLFDFLTTRLCEFLA